MNHKDGGSVGSVAHFGPNNPQNPNYYDPNGVLHIERSQLPAYMAAVFARGYNAGWREFAAMRAHGQAQLEQQAATERRTVVVREFGSLPNVVREFGSLPNIERREPTTKWGNL